MKGEVYRHKGVLILFSLALRVETAATNRYLIVFITEAIAKL
jgi:hypothetical protein